MSEWTFDRDAIAAFRFVRCDFVAESGVARLVYAFDEGQELVETITIPGAPFQLDGVRRALAISTPTLAKAERASSPSIRVKRRSRAA